MAKIGTLNFMALFVFIIFWKVNTKDDFILLNPLSATTHMSTMGIFRYTEEVRVGDKISFS